MYARIRTIVYGIDTCNVSQICMVSIVLIKVFVSLAPLALYYMRDCVVTPLCDPNLSQDIIMKHHLNHLIC
jgi:hypothetical protein